MKLKNILNAFIILAYILLIGAIIVDNESFVFKENWLMILNSSNKINDTFMDKLWFFMIYLK